MESSILSGLTVNEEEEEKEGDEDDEEISIKEVLPVVPSPIDALAAIKKLNHYHRNSDNNKEVLHLLTKIWQHILNKVITKAQQKKLAIFLQVNTIYTHVYVNLMYKLIGILRQKIALL